MYNYSVLQTLSNHNLLNKLPLAIRFGVFSGTTVALISTFVVCVIAATIAAFESGANFFESSFQESFLFSYAFIHILLFIVWIAIVLALTAFLIPEEMKRIKQSLLFFSNGLTAFFSFIAVNTLLFFIIYLALVVIAFIFRE